MIDKRESKRDREREGGGGGGKEGGGGGGGSEEGENTSFTHFWLESLDVRLNLVFQFNLPLPFQSQVVKWQISFASENIYTERYLVFLVS